MKLKFQMSLVVSVIFIISITSITTTAEETSQKTITLKECLVRAYKSVGAMNLQSEQIIQSSQKVNQAGSAFLPSVDFISKKTFQDTSNGAVGEYAESKLTATQSLYNGFKDKRLLSVTLSEKKMQELTLLSTYMNISKDVAIAYYLVLFAQSDIADAQENIEILQNRLTELNERVRLGKSRDTEVYSVESKLASVRAQIEVAKGAKISALAKLALLTGENVENINVEEDVAVKVALPSLVDVIKVAQERSDIKALEESIYQQELRVKIAQGSFFPMISLIGNYYALRPQSASDAKWDAVFTLDFPLFQGGMDTSKVNEERSKLRASKTTADYAKRQVEAEVRSLYSMLNASLGQLASLKESYDKADVAYSSLLKEYRLGLVNNLDVLAGISDLLNAKSSYNKSKIQLQQDNALLSIALQQI